MAFTVQAAFATFFDTINLKGDHRETANKRKDRIVELLSDKFDILDAFSTGSIPKFTALRQRADLDVMVVLHHGKHIKGKTPSSLLESVQKALSGYATRVRKNGQAVTLTFKTWPNVDIVPVSRVVNENNSVDYYNVPDANRAVWIPSRPRKLSTEMNNRASICGENFRRIIKMVKHWNKAHSDFLSSYHIEVMALRIYDSKIEDLPWEVFRFFDEAGKLLAGPLQYEKGNADDYLSSSDRAEAIKRVETATNKARDAWYETYGSRSNHKAAITYWKQLFGDGFPTHG